jgi:RNA polymerase sigma factor (sigma-70 family)
MDDAESILRYARTRSGADLEPVIRRHLNWVWSCALRQVRGDEDLAGDIVQAVFLVLMKKPPSPRHAGALAAWLFKVTRYVALNVIRTRGRRRAHEEKAAMTRAEAIATESEMSAETWQQLSPVLDDALAQLSGKDRQGVLLRYMQQRSFVEIGAAMGTSEEAARKRVNRAIDKLRGALLQKGVTAPAAMLSAGLLAWASQPAPAAVASAVTSTCAGAAATGSVVALSNAGTAMVAAAKMKLVAMVALVAILVPSIAIVAVTPLGDSTPATKAQATATPPPATTPLAMRGEVTVSATDSAGKPVEGAEVYVIQRLYPTDDVDDVQITTAGPVKTDAAGTARVTGLGTSANPAGFDHQVYLRVPGKLIGAAYRSMSRDDAGKRGGPDALTAKLAPATPVEFSVVVPDGFAAQDLHARVLFMNLRPTDGSPFGQSINAYDEQYEKTWPGLFRVSVGADGKFEIPDAPEIGSVAIAVEGKGLGQAQAMISRPDQKTASLLMQPEAIIAGTLKNVDGTDPAADVLLKLQPRSIILPYTGPSTLKTDQAGRFRFDGLGEGIYALVASPRKSDQWTMAVRDELRATPGQTLDKLDLKLERGAVVTGQISDKVTRKPVVKATIAAVSPAEINSICIATASSDGDGKFTMRLPTGSSMLYVMWPGEGYKSPKEQGRRVVTISPDGKVKGSLSFAFEPAVQKPVTFAKVKGRAQTADGKPLARINIGHMYQWSGDEPGMSLEQRDAVVTDDQGNFELKVEAQSKHEIFIGTPDYRSERFKFTPKPDEVVEVTLVGIAQPIVSQITGLVVDPDGKPLADAYINGSVGDSNATRTDAQGRFTLPLRQSEEPVHMYMLRNGYETRQWRGVPPGSTDVRFILYPTSRANKPRQDVALPNSARLLGNPAPPILAEAWAQTGAENQPPQFGNGRATLLMFTTESTADKRNIGTPLERIKRLEATARKMNAQAIALFEPDSHESFLRAMLADQKLPVAVGVDQYAAQSDYRSGGETRIAYGGQAPTQVFLIAADGTVADDNVKLDPAK